MSDEPAPDPVEGQWADVALIRAAVMAEVEHCVWASTGGRATGFPDEVAQLRGAEAVKDYLTRGGLDAALFRVVTDPRMGEWRRHLDWWSRHNMQ